MNTPSTFACRNGFTTDGVAAAALPQCYATMLDTSGHLVLATTGNLISGIAINNYAIGEVASIHKGGEKSVKVTGTVIPGDYLEVSATPGVLQAQGTSGATVNTADCVGRSKTTKDVDSLVFMESFGQ